MVGDPQGGVGDGDRMPPDPTAVMVGFGLEGVDAHRLTVLGVSLFGHGSDQSVYRVDAQRVEQGVQAGGGVDLVLMQGGGYSYREPEVACLRDAGEGPGMASGAAVVVVQRRAGRVKAHLEGDPLARHGFERRAAGAPVESHRVGEHRDR